MPRQWKQLSANNFTAAKEQIFAALNIQPKSIRLLSMLAETEIAAGNFSEAEKLIAQVASEYPELAAQLTGNLHESNNRPELAIKSYLDAWNRRPNEQLGSKLYSLLEQSNKSKATEFLEHWLKNNPESINALLVASRNLLIAGNFNAAIPQMKTIREKAPDNVVNLNNLAWSLQQIKDPQATTIAQEAYALAPDNANVADTYGWILYQNGSIEESRRILQKAAALDPGNTEIQQHLAQALEG